MKFLFDVALICTRTEIPKMKETSRKTRAVTECDFNTPASAMTETDNLKKEL